ncbi:MAG: TonB-dependent receptor [Woeseiaceae bacterium]|nr:TonB-dependent receptor [Woeseiaceae bacterium]
MLAVPAPTAALANAADPLDEVVVSAVRRDVTVSSVPAAISVVGTDDVHSRLLVTDALENAAGVFVQQTTPGQGSAILRGLKGSAILHLVDGMRLNNAIFRDAPTQYLSLVPVTAVERIEALRGTPASLYGSDAVGGIVNVVTRVPQFEQIESRTSGEVVAAFDSADLARSIRGTFDVGNRFAATSISLERLDTGNRRIGGGDRVGPSAYESSGGRLAMSVTPDDRHAWFFDVHYLEQPDTPRVDELVPGFGQTEPSSSEFSFAPNRRLFARARYSRSQGWLGLDWQVDSAWQRIDDDRVSRDFGADTRTIEQNSSDLSGAIVTATHEGQDNSWLAGVELYHDRVRSSRRELDITTGGEQTVASRFPDGSTLDRAAIFFNGERRIADRHWLSGGLRISTIDVDLPDTGTLSAARIDVTDVAGDLGWRFDIGESWQLVANIGYGFRAPNIFDLGTFGERPGNRFNIPNTDLDSERVLHTDAGVRRHGSNWHVEAVVFSLDYDDRIVSVLTGGTTADGRDIVQSVNAATSRIHGVELLASMDINESLRMNATLTWTRGNDRIGDAREPADRLPPLSGRVEVDYDISDAWSASAWVAFADQQERLSGRDIRDPRIDPDGTPGWASVGARAAWRVADSLLLTFGVDNLLDQRYRRHGSGIDAAGRSLSMSARYDW